MTPQDLVEIARLARLSAVDYDREKKDAAKRMGVSVGALNAQVKAARSSIGAGTGAGHGGKPLVLAEVKPWDRVVDGIELLAALITVLGRHVVLTAQQKLIIALWIIHTHCLPAASITPRLVITSEFPESGKTTLIKVIKHVVPKALHAISLKGPTLFRTIEEHHPTMLLDEANNWLFFSHGGFDDTRGDIMAIIDAGHERGVVVPRLAPSSNGKGEWEARGYDVFGALAIALIGRVPEQIDSRSIEIACVRRENDQKIVPLRARRPPPDLADVQRQCARWGADHVDMLDTWEPTIPEGVGNRTADNWETMLSIAEVIEFDAANSATANQPRPDYPKLAREAAIAVGSASKANRTNSNILLMLLTDLKWLFEIAWTEDQKRERWAHFKKPDEVAIFSEDIVKDLGGFEDRPWAEWGRAKKPITKVQLARLLKPLKIYPHNVRANNCQAKGYERSQFEKAFRIYL